MKKLLLHLLAWLPSPIVLILLLTSLVSVQEGVKSLLRGTETPAILVEGFIRIMCIYCIALGNQWVLRNKGFYRIVFITSIVSAAALFTQIMVTQEGNYSVSFAIKMFIVCSMIPLHVFCQRKLAARQAQLQSEPVLNK